MGCVGGGQRCLRRERSRETGDTLPIDQFRPEPAFIKTRDIALFSDELCLYEHRFAAKVRALVTRWRRLRMRSAAKATVAALEMCWMWAVLLKAYIVRCTLLQKALPAPGTKTASKRTTDIWY